MRSSNHYQGIMRWYPKSWRARYGEGLTALLEDTHGDKALSWKLRSSIARAGLVERARDAGFVAGTSSANDRLRVGSQLVLSGWVLFMVAGAMFAKFTEHYSAATPLASRSLANASYGAVQWAGGVGMVVVALAGLFVVPVIVRHLRLNSWRSIRRPLLCCGVALGVATVLIIATALRAHSLSAHQRNAGFSAYGALVLFCVVAVVIALLTVTSSAISISRQLTFSRRALTTLSNAAITLTVTMTVIIVGVLVWWFNEASNAPHFLANSLGSGLIYTSNSFPPTLMVATAPMMFGLGIAYVGVVRVVEGFRAAQRAISK